MGGQRQQRPDAATTFVSFADSALPEMESLAHAIAVLHPDELVAARIRRAIDPAVVENGHRSARLCHQQPSKTVGNVVERSSLDWSSWLPSADRRAVLESKRALADRRASKADKS